MEPSQRSAMGEVASTSALAASTSTTNLRRLHRNSSGDTSNKRSQPPSSDQDRPLIDDDFVASDSKSINGFSHALKRWDKLRVPVLVLHGLLLMIIICILSLYLLTIYPSKSGSVFYRSSSLKSPPSPKTKYSGTEAGHGVVWFLNTHQIRRQRQKRSSASGPERKQSSSESRARVTGLAKSCGHSCNFRLKSDVLNHDSHAIESQRELVIYFERWRQISKPQTNQTDSESKVVPLVQYMDAEDRTHARFSTVSPDCLYSAAVLGSTEKGIVNLCEKHGGLFGTLVLEDGAYMIEPIEHKEYRNHQERTQQADLSAAAATATDEPDNSNEEASSEEDTVDENSLRRRRSLSIDLRPHLIFRAPRQSFEHPISDHSTNETVDDEAFTYENTTEWVDTNRRSERSRRSANSWDHFVEVLVVADFKMLLYHQGNLEAYILTLFSTVASIYRHPTLRASINIIVVRIIILKHERAGPMISNRAQETLQQFCAWQQNYNDPNDDALSHHDVAILLTRHDICRATNKCDTLGLAELGTMCDGQRSCAIIEDNGLSAAFTIAHELGHIFNIPHDDERKCAHYMQLNKHNYHIMAPTLEYNTHPWSWSACSSAMLSKFLDDSRAQTQCILDQPIERKYYDKMFENPAPGAKYSVDQQCQFVFGANAEICPYMPTCRRLWCSTYVGYQMGCRTQHMPWADGTPCGDNKWCHRGQCVGMAPNQRSKQDGSWGEWREWEDCSRTCGGGIQKALRDCDSPKPSNGGKYCVGQRERYRPCNIQECPWDTLGFREMQCAEFDNTNVGIHGVPLKTSWVPKYSGVSRNERCKLYCRVKDSQAFYLLKDRVLDGTPCDQNGDDICIDGTCHAAGCDHRLGSPMRRDVCGICGGDGSTCQTVEGVFNERGSFGYNEVLKIPAGSANIDIKQNAYNHNKDDDNYLALRASNGEFLLNGQYQVSVFRQQISVQDTVLEYSGSDHSVERINGTGPIRSDIYLHVLSVGNLNPPDIHYKYMVPRENSPVHRPSAQFYWRFSDQYTECSKICQGTQFRVLHCVDATSNRQTHDGHCTSRKPDPEERMCNIDCSIKWRTKDVSGCSARCGHGEKQQESICIRTSSRRREETIAEHECTRSGLAKPPTRIRCYSDCTGRKWSYTDWSPCTATCGNSGTSRRSVMCVDDNNRSIDNRHCESIVRETLEQECNRIPCPRWNYGHWSECSRSCDGGVRIRHAQCQSAAGQDLPSHLCNAAERDDRQKCNENVCTSWKFGSWSECSASCGAGTQTRTAECLDSWGRKMDDARCNADEHIVSKPCKKIDCPHWEMSSWSQCSVSCQDGWMTRSVYCVDTNGKKIRDEFCTRTDPVRPPSHQVCNHGPCPFWRHGDWSRCSVTCGYGVRYRDIECIFRDETVDKSLCQKSQQPKEHETCKLLPCTHWRTNPWSSCSVTCGVGVQLRTVTCMPSDYSHEALEDRHCAQHLKPRTERRCERKCPIDAAGNTIQNQQSQIYWATGPWTDCSATCDNGTQMRQVVCHDHIRQLPDEYCRHIEKEQNKRDCNMKPCTMWSVGSWAECPATCGVQHIQRRSVVCTDLGGKPLNETACDATSQPESERNCGLPACPSEPRPIIGIWSTGDWAECSVSCGGGWRRRTVSCDEDVCDEKVKPSQFERCNEQNCTKAAWQITPWSPCSVSCGDKGLQERKIWCQEDINSTQRLPDAECVKHEPKPSMRRGCARRPCPDKNYRIATNSIKPNTTSSTNRLYNWHAAEWNPCSATCGRGLKSRTVVCVNMKSNQTVKDEHCVLVTKPLTMSKCRVSHCARWHKSRWSMAKSLQCSTSCGTGLRTREVVCKKGRKVTEDKECAAVPKPDETMKCIEHKCPVYHWKSTPWSKCVDPCKKATQHRRVYCLNEQGKRAASRMCENSTMPIKSQECVTDNCPYEWVPGPWSTCSRTCGTGNHFRRIDCKVKRTMLGQNTPAGSEPTVLARMCIALEKPDVNKECAMNPCDAEYRWSVLPWGKCSKNCGPGVRRRKTPCLNRSGIRVPRAKCNQTTRPKHREPCFLRNCLPNDCAEIKAQNTKTHSIDGNYTVLVAGFRVSVFCYLMNNTIPKTYLNLNPETNFGEFYGKRLKYPYSCPYEGRRNDTCDCTNDGHVNSGLTRFSRVRVDLHNMKINPHDFTFAQTPYGNQVAYGTAGDCYSGADCPQGRFSIDLTGTGLKIVDDLQWMDHGHKSGSRIIRSKNNALIQGQCGGFCGECAPDQYKGIVIEIDHKQRPSIGVG